MQTRLRCTLSIFMGKKKKKKTEGIRRWGVCQCDKRQAEEHGEFSSVYQIIPLTHLQMQIDGSAIDIGTSIDCRSFSHSAYPSLSHL